MFTLFLLNIHNTLQQPKMNLQASNNTQKLSACEAVIQRTNIYCTSKGKQFIDFVKRQFIDFIICEKKELKEKQRSHNILDKILSLKRKTKERNLEKNMVLENTAELKQETQPEIKLTMKTKYSKLANLFDDLVRSYMKYVDEVDHQIQATLKHITKTNSNLQNRIFRVEARVNFSLLTIIQVAKIIDTFILPSYDVDRLSYFYRRMRKIDKQCHFKFGYTYILTGYLLRKTIPSFPENYNSARIMNITSNMEKINAYSRN